MSTGSTSARFANGLPGPWNGRIRRSAAAVSCGLSLLVLGSILRDEARATEPNEAVESGRRALSQHGDYPWYDAREDALRRIEVKTPRESAINRDSM